MSSQQENVPKQQKGGQSNIEASAHFSSENEARRFFDLVKKRLLNVNQWKEIARGLSAQFTLTDANGNICGRMPRQGDYFKIEIPAPDAIAGDDFDWVRVEEIEEAVTDEEQSISIRVRPAANPTNTTQEIAHFFSDDATSNFIVQQSKTSVKAAVYGRNEKPNTDVDKLIDKGRNLAIATGAISIFSKLQWQNLVDGFVNKD